MTYTHRQFSYPIAVITIAMGIMFVWIYITASAEPPSIDSGPNLLLTSIMIGIILILISFITLHVCVDDTLLRIKFCYGIYKRTFLLHDIVSVAPVKNKRYYGRGIRLWLWPKMVIYNIAGFDAVEIQLKNGSIYRIGTDEPQQLHQAILDNIQKQKL